MNYTLAGLRQRVLIDKLDDEDFDGDVVDNFINDAQRDIFSEYTLPFTEKIFTGALPAGVNMFQFPDDVSQIQAIMVTDNLGNGRDIKDHFMTFRDFNRTFPGASTAQAGYVNQWTLYGDKMITSRPTGSDYTMTIFYNRVPKDLEADDDIPEVPKEFAEALILGAYYRVQLREGDSDEALLTKSEYQRKMEQMVERYGYRVASGPIQMRNRQVGR